MRAKAGTTFEARLTEVPTRRMHRRLVRCVPHLDFAAVERPGFLYTSGRANRCNPEGVECLYFSEDERTADDEFWLAWHGTSADHQPKLTFTAQVRLRKIVDLEKPEARRALGLSKGDLEANWRLAATATKLQLVGLAVSRQHSITAIRYPSAAARKRGRSGWNVAIYPAALGPWDRVEILSASDEPLEVLP